MIRQHRHERDESGFGGRCGHRGERFARRGWGEDHGWGRHGHGGRFGGGRRFFEQGDLKVVILALIAEKPRHGYELIKEIEERFGGAYAPSPGVVYPLLTMLEEMGQVTLSPGDGGKKLYAITPEGQATVAQNKEITDALFARIAAVRERFGRGAPPPIVRGMENLRLALRLKLERGALSDEQAQAVAAALDAAAQAIDRA